MSISDLISYMYVYTSYYKAILTEVMIYSSLLS